MNFKLWNQALQAKHVWDVAINRDSRLISWVHTRYLKTHDWWDWSTSAHVHWYWRKLVKSKGSCEGWFSRKEVEAIYLKMVIILQRYNWLLKKSANAVWDDVA